MDGVINDRTINVSKSRPKPMVVPIWPSARRSLNMNEDMVNANTRPAVVTTPVPAMARMMPVGNEGTEPERNGTNLQVKRYFRR
jgi:hypothetical protein